MENLIIFDCNNAEGFQCNVQNVLFRLKLAQTLVILFDYCVRKFQIEKLKCRM